MIGLHMPQTSNPFLVLDFLRMKLGVPFLHGNYCPNVMEYLENKKWPHFFRNEQAQVQKCKDTFKKEIAQVIHRAKC